MTETYVWRGEFDNASVNALHAEAFGSGVLDEDWRGRVERHSLGWVCARDGDDLIGFANVAWDGAIHAFLLDTIVAPRAQRRGVGTGLVAVAINEARSAGCEWLHVDFAENLQDFYLDSCGFVPTSAGLIRL